MGTKTAPRPGKPDVGIPISVIAWLKKRAENPSRLGPATDLGPFCELLESLHAPQWRFVPELVPTCNETDRKAEKPR